MSSLPLCQNSRLTHAPNALENWDLIWWPDHNQTREKYNVYLDQENFCFPRLLGTWTWREISGSFYLLASGLMKGGWRSFFFNGTILAAWCHSWQIARIWVLHWCHAGDMTSLLANPAMRQAQEAWGYGFSRACDIQTESSGALEPVRLLFQHLQSLGRKEALQGDF